MEIKKAKNSGTCGSCGITNKKSDFQRRQIAGINTYICKKCGYRNGDSIFFEYKKVKNQQLEFGKFRVEGKKIKKIGVLNDVKAN